MCDELGTCFDASLETGQCALGWGVHCTVSRKNSQRTTLRYYSFSELACWHWQCTHTLDLVD